MFTMIQSSKYPTHNALIALAPGAYVSPAGYVIGEYRTVFPKLTRQAALRILASHFHKDNPVSLWWTGAAEEVAGLIQTNKEA